jgi:pyruvate,orthophosphate dikinase
MIELPRACIRADEIAEEADFFSFGTNDLTQNRARVSRVTTPVGKFLTRFSRTACSKRNPFEVLDEEGVGDLMEIAVDRGRGAKVDLKLGICGEHGGEPRSVAFCPPGCGSTTCRARRSSFRSHASAAAQAALARDGRGSGPSPGG